MPTGIYKRTKEMRDKISKGMLGHFVSEETKLKCSLAKIGDKNPSYRKPLSKKQKRALDRKGIPLSKEHKLKIGNSNKGKIRSEETKKKLSEVHKGRYRENSNNWKGGRTALKHLIRNNFKYRQWRSDIFTRDDFTCQYCGQIGGRLFAHHIKSFSSILQKYEITTLEEALECEELFNMNNGLTLCEKCHKKIGLHKGIIKTNAKNISKIS